MSRDYRLFLDDIKTACQKVLRYTSEMSYEQFINDEKTYDAVVRNLEVIGEAAKKVPDEVRERYPDIEWKKISGFRDIAIHEYYNMDEEILWDVVKNRIPELLEQVTEILTKADKEEPEDEKE
ncbi:MAG: DUF86 domain-containing protein [Chloroflexi bacterium]|nr:DUF86 domain-containing protein [Chloroflexota bacterium]